MSYYSSIYVIVTASGKFVTPPGSARSYTTDLTKARTFQTRAAAQRQACENERVMDIEGILRTPEA